MQLLGVVDGDQAENVLPSLVAGRFLPMVEDPSWFSTPEAQWQKRGEEMVPPVSLPKESVVEFVYPSMHDLGELVFCRVWHDHQWNSWHLHRAEVAVNKASAGAIGGAGPWEFPCDDWVKDETRPVPVELRLPADSQGYDGLLELMERKQEADLEHKLSQELGLTEDEVNLFAASRNILKRKLQLMLEGIVADTQASYVGALCVGAARGRQMG